MTPWSGSGDRPGVWARYVVCIVTGSNCTVADNGRGYEHLDDALARRDELRAGGCAATVCELVTMTDIGTVNRIEHHNPS